MSRIRVLVLLLVSLPFTVFAQVTTQTKILREAAQKQAALEAKTKEELLKLAIQKNWPLTIQNSKGQYAILVGTDFQGYPMYTTTTNNTVAAATIGTNQLWPGGLSGLNLSGSDNSVKGKLGIWDGGKVLATHQEFGTRISQVDAPTDVSDHATHVAGTMIASGLYPLAKGMAFGAQQLMAYDFNNHLSEMFTASGGLLVSNHSYGSIAGWRYNDAQSRWEFWGQANTNEDYKFGYYSNEAQVWDSIAYNAPYYLIVKSAGNNRSENGPTVGSPYWRYDASGNMVSSGNRPAGISDNDGYDIIPTYGVAKNILTVGATEALETGYSKASDVLISDFSSWGPTDDGRIKPDVVADGVNLLSTYGTANNAYAILSGTSMSTPSVSGSIYLLQEYYARLKGGSFMRAATLKGLVIHTASEAGSDPGPDYVNGWGLVNIPAAANIIKSNNTKQLIREEVLNNGGTFTLPVVVSGDGPFAATISWTDPKGAVETVSLLDNPAIKLINDLDIRIKKGATTYQPWTLNPAAPASAAVAGDNIRDNVEKVEVSDAVPGATYTIEVKHKGTLERGTQAFSLIVSGVGGTAYCASAPTSTTGSRIDSVSIGATLRKGNPAGCTGYTDYTSQTAEIEANSTLPYYVKVSSCDATTTNKVVKIFIDLNSDGDFADANELIATSAVINGNGVFSGNATIPSGITTNNASIMRIIVQETSNPAAVVACGTYTNGETQDYKVKFVTSSKDVGVFDIVSPSSGDCASGSQYIVATIKNFGRVAQTSIPLTAVVKNGATTIATITETYPSSIADLSSVRYTFQTPFTAVAGATYTITVTTGLSGDQNASNDIATSSVTISSVGSGSAGTGAICSPTQAILKVTNPVSGNLYSWYETANGTTPLGVGSTLNTSTITANKTYYLATNEPTTTKVGPANKMVYTDGGYNAFAGNFIRFSNSVPVMIQSARLYTGNAGQITFIVANLVSFNESTGSYSYQPLASTTIDVWATDPTPQAGAQTGNDPADLGAVFTLNLPVETTGDHIIIVQCANGATLFRNNNLTTNPYPFTIPGVFSITGNSATSATDATLYQKFYYFFYDMKIALGDCATSRTAVVATNATAPTISASGNTLSSTVAGSYQWYQNGTLIIGANNQTYTATSSGTYKVVVSDAAGCSLTSNEISLTITAVTEIDGSTITLKATPNPSNGVFNVSFEMKKKGTTVVSLLNATGQELYEKSYPDFIGKYNETLTVPGKSKGIYLLKIQQGDRIYLKKVIVQ
ncbi:MULTISPECIES: S8 family serine peptidase [unclassified Paraflavitalea]|uniref:S8 family serine peptidase n=1 Tax=unclassified Paraflavitalea TaxID=2798305 RepID=UPI003D34BB8B